MDKQAPKIRPRSSQNEQQVIKQENYDLSEEIDYCRIGTERSFAWMGHYSRLTEISNENVQQVNRLSNSSL